MILRRWKGKLATGGESSPKPKRPNVVTRSSSRAVKSVDYQQMIMGKYRDGALVDEYGYGDNGENQSDPDFYQGATAGAFIQPEVDPFMGNLLCQFHERILTIIRPRKRKN